MKVYRIGFFYTLFCYIIASITSLIFIQNLYLLWLFIPVIFLFLFFLSSYLNYSQAIEGAKKFSITMSYCLIVLAIPTIIGSILLYLGQKKVLNKLEEISTWKNNKRENF